MRRSLICVTFLVGALALAQNVNYRPDAEWQPPAAAAARVNPLRPEAKTVAGGRKLFIRHCAECHGEDGGGLKSAADLQMPVVQQQSDGALHWKITNGNGRHGMPSFGSLPELQRWQIVLYLRTLKPAAAEEAGEVPGARR